MGSLWASHSGSVRVGTLGMHRLCSFFLYNQNTKRKLRRTSESCHASMAQWINTRRHARFALPIPFFNCFLIFFSGDGVTFPTCLLCFFFGEINCWNCYVCIAGDVILLGKTNMLRFNHPQEAAKLRKKRYVSWFVVI